MMMPKYLDKLNTVFGTTLIFGIEDSISVGDSIKIENVMHKVKKIIFPSTPNGQTKAVIID